MEKFVSWFDIFANDFDRAVKFYSEVFEVKLVISECESEKMACFPNGAGAISQAKGFKPSEDGVLLSLNAGKDIEAALKRIVERGGKIVIPKTKLQVEGLGYFAVFIDCEGNKLGLYGDN